MIVHVCMWPYSQQNRLASMDSAYESRQWQRKEEGKVLYALAEKEIQ